MEIKFDHTKDCIIEAMGSTHKEVDATFNRLNTLINEGKENASSEKVSEILEYVLKNLSYQEVAFLFVDQVIIPNLCKPKQEEVNLILAALKEIMKGKN